MTQGLLKKLALAAPFVVCLPLCAFGADGNAAQSDDNPRIFEEFSLTAATVEAPIPAPNPPAPGMASVGGNGCGCGTGSCCPTNCCQNSCNSCCGDPCGSSCQHQSGIFDTCGNACSNGLHNFFSCGDNCCCQFFTGVEATV